MRGQAARVCAFLLVSAAWAWPASAQKVSRSAQVVLIVRIPDTFTVHWPGKIHRVQPQRADSAVGIIHFPFTGHLLPGTSITAACLLDNQAAGLGIVPASAGGEETYHFVRTGSGRASPCNGTFFKVLPGPDGKLSADIFASARRIHAARLDIYFSAI